ncbi:MAG: hypothetical protein QM805_10840 [Pseudomonas sp.]
MDGIGALHDRGRLGARVNIQLSEIHAEFIDDPYSVNAETGVKLNYLEHVATLQDFKLGTIWRDGKRVRRAPPYGAYEINTKHARFMRLHADANFGNGYRGQLIPEDQFITGDTRKNLLYSHYAQIPILNNKNLEWLIIPCTEILRFYYGASRRLLSSILQGKSENFYSPELSKTADNKAILHVKKRLSRKEAAVLARDKFSPEELNSIRRVHKYLSALSTNNSTTQRNVPLTIQSRFPFSDKTKITVSGIVIHLPSANGSERSVKALLVMEIFHCSHPFPFDTLVLESDKPFDSKNASGGQPGSENGPRFTPEFEDDEDEDTLDLDSQIQADARLKRLSEIIPTNQLGGIDNIRFEHSRPKLGTNGNQPTPEVLVPISDFTQNDGDYSEEGKGNLGVSHFLSHLDVARDLSVFLEMLNNIRRKKSPDGWHIKTISFTESATLDGECICSFPSKIGKRRRWHLVADGNSGFRPRQVVLAEFSHADDFIFYLAEMELQPDDSKQCTIIIKTKNAEKISEDTFNNLLKLSALQRRWLSPSHKWEYSEHELAASKLFTTTDIYRINHPKASKQNSSSGPTPHIDPDKWSDYLIEKIQELMSLD